MFPSPQRHCPQSLSLQTPKRQTWSRRCRWANDELAAVVNDTLMRRDKRAFDRFVEYSGWHEKLLSSTWGRLVRMIDSEALLLCRRTKVYMPTGCDHHHRRCIGRKNMWPSKMANAECAAHPRVLPSKLTFDVGGTVRY